MSDARPPAPATRPATARPRSDIPPEVVPPTPDELARIVRHVAAQSVHDGAVISDDDDLRVVRSHRDRSGPEHTYAAMPRWRADEWPERLTRLRDRMLAEGSWPSLVLTDFDVPAGIASVETVMRAAGWAPVLAERALWVGHASVVPHLDPSLRIEAVLPRSVADHEALERLAFGIGQDRAEDRRRRLADALATGALRAFVVRVDGEPVAVARLSQGEGVAGLTGIGVHPAHRRRGLGTLVTVIATRAGLATGNRIVWLSVREEDDTAASLYAKLGFRPAFRWTRWLATEGAA